MVSSVREMKDSGIEWIGEIPEGWTVESSKGIFVARKERARKDDVMLTASQRFGMIPQERYDDVVSYKTVKVIKDEDILKHVESGDFVISMRSFQGGLEYSEYRGKMSSAYLALYPRQGWPIIDGYYKYLFKSHRYIQSLQRTSNLVRDGQALRYANFIQVPIPYPPLDEQRRIANYLGERCTVIDEVRSTIEDQIEALRRLRKATIHRAVVTGLTDAPKVKLSHMAWVGSSTRVFTNELVDSGIPFFRGTEIGAKAVGKFDTPSLYITNEHYERLVGQTGKVSVGDLLLPSICYEGQIWHVDNDEPFYFKDGRVLWIRPNHALAEGRFLRYALASELQLNYELYASGTTFAEMKIVTLKQVPVPFASLSEQQRIADYLDERCAAIDSVIDTRTRQLERLDDYRRALIFAYVTGKKEVPTHA